MRCIGRFFVDKRVLLEDQYVAEAIFNGLVILETRYRYDRDGTEYMAIGNVFDEIPEGFEAPIYQVEMIEGKVKFIREG